MELKRADSPTRIDYAPPMSVVRIGVLDALIGFIAAMGFAVLLYRFKWPWLLRCYELAKSLLGFGQQDSWGFAISVAVIIAGPVAFMGAVATVLSSRIRSRRRS